MPTGVRTGYFDSGLFYFEGCPCAKSAWQMILLRNVIFSKLKKLQNGSKILILFMEKGSFKRYFC